MSSIERLGNPCDPILWRMFVDLSNQLKDEF